MGDVDAQELQDGFDDGAERGVDNLLAQRIAVVAKTLNQVDGEFQSTNHSRFGCYGGGLGSRGSEG